LPGTCPPNLIVFEGCVALGAFGWKTFSDELPFLPRYIFEVNGFGHIHLFGCSTHAFTDQVECENEDTHENRDEKDKNQSEGTENEI
jgi:hypothetical protein